MKRPPTRKGRPITRPVSKANAEMKKELADLNQRHMKLMEEHAGLRGRHDGLIEVHQRTKHELKHKELEMQAIQEALAVAEANLLELSRRVTQIEGNAVPALPIRGQ
jgi:chromosome segregation ATPase